MNAGWFLLVVVAALAGFAVAIVGIDREDSDRSVAFAAVGTGLVVLSAGYLLFVKGS